MGIVKISDLMHENLRIASQAMSRSINSQAEHWLKSACWPSSIPRSRIMNWPERWCRQSWMGGWRWPVFSMAT
ncbi:hypothetical protein ERHA55_53860 (plasmid) [Erwinia rhapontici]|nr:hypothetical protein ERHA55_53860 [Erwinia rhapontici]